MYLQTNVLFTFLHAQYLIVIYEGSHMKQAMSELHEFFSVAVSSYYAFSIVLIVFHFCLRLLLVPSYRAILVLICLMPVACFVSTYIRCMCNIPPLHYTVCKYQQHLPERGGKKKLLWCYVCKRRCSKEVLQLPGSTVPVAIGDVSVRVEKNKTNKKTNTSSNQTKVVTCF